MGDDPSHPPFVVEENAKDVWVAKANRAANVLIQQELGEHGTVAVVPLGSQQSSHSKQSLVQSNPGWAKTRAQVQSSSVE